MALYFKDIEITNIDNLVPQTGLDITDLWFGSTNVYTVWQTYEGTLPAAINANGSDLKQYQVWGDVGGVGDKTVQLFDKNATDITNGYVSGAYIKSNGELQNSSAWFVSEYIPVNAEEQYTVVYGSQSSSRAVCYYDINKNYISGANYSGLSTQETITTASTCAYIRFSLVLAAKDVITVTPGTTLPETYVPFGYEVDIGVKSGNLFDRNAKKSENGYLDNTYIRQSDGSYVTSTDYYLSEYISVEPNKLYTWVFTFSNSGARHSAPTIEFLNASKNRISWAYHDISIYNFSVNIPQNCAFIRASVYKETSDNSAFVLGLPDKYQPYYNTTTPIYIGDEPLGKDEYVDYTEQKVYRMINSTLTPTDPPVPLPALPTCEGVTIVDFSGSGTVPEKAILKYRKGGF